MSVEEARCELTEYANDNLGAIITPNDWNERVDRLILEVQAAMPCYWQWSAGRPALPCQAGESERCPPCTARAELAKRKVAV